MSLEDKLKDAAKGFASTITNIQQKATDYIPDIVKDSPIFTPMKISSKVNEFIRGTEDTRNSILNSADNITGGIIGRMKHLISDDNDIPLDDEETMHTYNISKFDKEGNHNVIETLGLGETEVFGKKVFSPFTSGDDPVSYIKGDETEFKTRLAEIEEAGFSEEITAKATAFYGKIEEEINKELNAAIKDDIANQRIGNDIASINRRRQAIESKIRNEVESRYSQEHRELNQEADAYLTARKQELAAEYIKPDEGTDAWDTYNKTYSKNSSVRKDQYLMENVVKPKMEAIFPAEAWTAKTNADPVLTNMMTEMQEKILRDEKYYYEHLSAVETPEERAKVKGMLRAQNDARYNYFSDVVREYKAQIDSDEITDEDDMISTAYDKAFEALSPEDKKALLVRDGTDTMANLYYNYKETGRRFRQKDLSGIMMGIGNVLQVGLDGLGGIVGAGVSIVSSTTFKRDDKSKIFFDEYELSTTNDSIPMKVVKHVTYNVDDLAELVIPVGVSGKFNAGAKVIDKGIKGLQKISANAKTLNPTLQYTVRGLSATARGGLYGARGVAEGFPANVIADRQLRSADTDANAYVNVLGDMLLEPVFHVVGKKLRPTGEAAATSVNNISQSAFAMMRGEQTPKQAMLDLKTNLAKEGVEVSEKEAYSLMRQSRDLVYATTGKKAQDIFRGADISLLHKNIADNLKKLEDSAKVGADKIYTPEGTILKLEDVTSIKKEANNEIDRAFNLISVNNEADKLIGAGMLDKLLRNAESITKGQVEFAGGRIRLSKDIKKAELVKVQTAIENIKKQKSLDVKKDLTYRLYNKLIDLRNSSSNQADRIEPKVYVTNVMSGQSLGIKLSDLYQLEDYNQVLSDLVNKGTVNITKETRDLFGTKQVGTFSTYAAPKHILSKLKEADGQLFDIFTKGLVPGKKGTFSTGTDKIAYEDFDEVIEMLTGVFGDDIKFVDLGDGTKKTNRVEIMDSMKEQEGIISVAYGKQTYQGKDRVVMYVGAGKELIDKGFDFAGDYMAYHEKSSKALLDILSQDTIQDGIDFARPINNIGKFEELSGAHIESFTNDKLVEAGYGKVTLDKEVILDEKGESIKKFIKETFIHTGRQKDTLSKYVFEVFATKVINNYDLMKAVFTDINKLNGHAGVGVFPATDIIKTQDALNDLIKAFSGRKTVKRSADEHRVQFNTEKYRKEARTVYRDMINETQIVRDSLEVKRNTLTRRLGTSVEQPVIQKQIASLDEQIKRLDAKLGTSEKQFIKTFTDSLYLGAFDNFFKKKVVEMTGLVKGIQAEDLPSAKTISGIVEERDKYLEQLLGITEANKTKLTPEDYANVRKQFKEKRTLLADYNKQLAELDTRLDLEKRTLIENNLSEGLQKELSKDAYTLKEIYTIANKYKDEFDINPDARDWFLDRITTLQRFKREDNKKIPLGLFSEDAIRFISKKSLKKKMVNLLDNERDFYLVKDESPVTKVFGTALSGATNSERLKGETLFQKLKEEFGGEGANLKELYFTSPKLKEFVNSFRSKGKVPANVAKEAKANFARFKTFIDSHIDEMDYIISKDGSRYSREESINLLKSDRKMYDDLYKRFKALSNNRNDGVKIEKIQTGVNKQGFPVYEIQRREGIITDNILLTTDLQNKFDGDYRVINIKSAGDLKYLRFTLDGKEQTLGQLVRTDEVKKKAKGEYYHSDVDTLKHVIRHVNETNQYKVGTPARARADAYRAQLGLADNEFMMGTYGDKDNALQIYRSDKTDINEIIEDFTKKFALDGGFYRDGKQIRIADINKRETALVSSQKVFEDVEIDTKTIVIGEEVFEEGGIQDLISEMKNTLNKSTRESKVLSEQFYERLLEADPTLNNPELASLKFEDFFTYVENTYGTDLFDGTSYMSRNLAELHDVISTGTSKGKDKAKKFHYTGLTADNERYLGKTLFNRADVQLPDADGVMTPTNNVVLIGESSVKLKGGYKEFAESAQKTVKVNGKTFKVVGEIKGTNTSSFRDATADSFKEKDAQAVSEQIINNMSFDVRAAYQKIVIKEMQELRDEMLGGIGKSDIDLPTFGDTNIFLNNLTRTFDVGGTTDSMIQARIKQYLDGAKKIIEKNTEAGASHTILHSEIKLPSNAMDKSYLERDEIVVSKNSHLYKNAVKDMTNLADELRTKESLTPAETKKLTFLEDSLASNSIFVTGYRYPVGNVENMGVYKLVLAEDVGYNNKRQTYVGSDDVILHPETTYMKIQGDNDGDHFLMIPVVSEKSELLARTALGYNVEDDLLGALSNRTFKNKVAIIEQIPEPPKQYDAAGNEIIPPEPNIIEGRMKNLEAKMTIPTTASVIRGLNIFKQTVDQIKRNQDNGFPITKILNEKVKGAKFVDGKQEDYFYSVKEIFDTIIELEGREKGSYSTLLQFDETYGGKVGSILQLVLDFAKDKSGRPFPKNEWIGNLMKAAGLTQPETRQFFFNSVLSPLAASHKQATNKLSVSGIKDVWASETNPLADNKLINSSLGYRRDMVGYFASKFAGEVVNMKKSLETGFMLDKIFGEIKKGEVPATGKRFMEYNGIEKEDALSLYSLLKEVKENDKFLGRKIREKILDSFDGYRNKSSELAEFLNTYDRLYKKHTNDNGRTDFQEVLKEMNIRTADGELTITPEERNILAVYSMGDGNTSMFNLLTDGERIDILEYSEKIRVEGDKYLDSVTGFNEDYAPKVFLETAESIDDAKANLNIQKSEIEAKVAQIEADIAEIMDDFEKGSKRGTDELVESIEALSKTKNDLEELLEENIKTRARLKPINKKQEAREAAQEDLDNFLNPEDLEDNVATRLDINYELGDVNVEHLDANIKKANDIRTLMTEGAKLKLEGQVSAWRPELIQKMNTARELNGAQAIMVRQIKHELEQELVSLFKKNKIPSEALELMGNTLNGAVLRNVKFKDGIYKLDVEGLDADVKKGFEGQGDVLSQGEIDLFLPYISKFATDIYEPLVAGLTKLNTYYKDQGGYTVKYNLRNNQTFVGDMIEFYTGGLSFELRRQQIMDAPNKSQQKLKFVKYLQGGAEKNGVKFNDSRARQIYESLFKPQDGLAISLTKQFQGIHYAMNYSLPSLILGGAGHVAGFNQIIGNSMEMFSFGRVVDNSDVKIANSILDKYNLYGEDTAMHGQGLDAQLADTVPAKLQQAASIKIKTGVNSVMKKLGYEDPVLRNKLANTIDTWLTEPLLATDMIQDQQRRQVAALHVMRQMGIDNPKQLDEFMQTSKDKDNFKTLFYRKYVEMGGGVISTSPIYRETFLTTVDPDGTFANTGKLFTTMYRFLNGWSIHKLATMAEKGNMLVSAANKFASGDVADAKLLVKEFTDYSTAMMLNIGMAGGLAVKMEKYDNSPDNEQTPVEYFAMSAVNNLVSADIMFSRLYGNITADTNGDIGTKLTLVMLDELKHMTRQFKNNPVKIATTMQERMDTLDEGMLTAFYRTLQGLSGSYMRGSAGMAVQTITQEAEGESNLALLGYGVDTRDTKAMREVREANRIGKIDTLGFSSALTDLYQNILGPSYLGAEVEQHFMKKMFEDEDAKLIMDKGLGANGYNLDNIFIKDGVLKGKTVKDMWAKFFVYQSVGTSFDEKGRKVSSTDRKLYNKKMDDLITQQLINIGITKEDFVRRPTTRTVALQKLMYETQFKDIPELSTKHLTAYIANNQYKAFEKAYKQSAGIKYSDGYSLEDTEKALIQYNVMKNLQEEGILDLNLENHKQVLDKHIEVNNPELHKKMKKDSRNAHVLNTMEALMISTKNMQEGDTNAKFLTSKYRLAFKGLLSYYHGGKPVEPTSDAMAVVERAGMKFIERIVNSGQPGKETTAKIAAVLQGMNEGAWNLFKDNDKFNLLTKPAQKKLISWMYKTSNDLQDYDADSISNYPNKNIYGTSGRSRYASNMFRKGFKSGFSSGARPGFSKQFKDFPKFLQGKPISTNYNQIATGFMTPDRIQLRQLQFPVMKEIVAEMVRQSYNEVVNPQAGVSKIRTKRAAAKKNYVRTKKGQKAYLKKDRKPKKGKTFFRYTTIKGLPSEIPRL